MNNTLKKRFSSLPLLAAVCLPLLFGGCGKKEDMKPPMPELPVMTVKLSDASVSSAYSTLLEGRVDVEIRPQVDGTLQKIYVDEGAAVKAGQPLFKVDDRVYREVFNSALAAQHSTEAALAVAKIEVEKLEPLVKNNVVSDFQLKTAKAQLQAARAAVEQAKAAARSAAVNLDYTIVKAPVSGYIGKIPLRIGSLVSKNQDAWLTLLSDVSEVYAYFSMSETDFMRFRKEYPGLSIAESLKQVPPVSLLLADGSLFAEKGSLDTVSGQFDSGTGSVRIRASFPNPQGLLRSGNTGKVMIESRFSGVVQVPQSATVELQDKIFVFVLGSGNKVRKQVITVSGSSSNNYIVSSGLKEGDTILTAGIEKLQDGTVIKPLGNAPAAAVKAGKE